MSTPLIHENQPVFAAGMPLADAQVVVILLHGRSSTAQHILSLVPNLPQAATAYLAPQAAYNTWYPQSGFVPLAENEPYISSALHMLRDLLANVTAAGIPPEKTVIGGFSQGACLAAEFVARHARRYGGLFVLSGALLGPPDLTRQYAGSLDETPVFIAGCDHDVWVTEQQLRLTAQALTQLGGNVQLDIQSGSEHTVRANELLHVSHLIDGVPG